MNLTSETDDIMNIFSIFSLSWHASKAATREVCERLKLSEHADRVGHAPNHLLEAARGVKATDIIGDHS